MNKEKNKTMTFDEVMKRDQELQYLAAYELNGGKMIAPKTIEELMELNIKIVEKFNYFKGLIHRGECTFEFIKNDVLSRNGPYPQSKIKLDTLMPSSFDKVDVKDVAPINKENDIVQSLIDRLVGSLFPGATTDKVESSGIGSDGIDNGIQDAKISFEIIPPKQIKKPKKSSKRKKKNNN